MRMEFPIVACRATRLPCGAASQVWRRGVSQAKLARGAHTIAKSLFTLDAAFCDALRDVRCPLPKQLHRGLSALAPFSLPACTVCLPAVGLIVCPSVRLPSVHLLPRGCAGRSKCYETENFVCC